MTVPVTMRDVEERFGRSPEARRRLNWWASDDRRQVVVETMRSHTSDYANTIASEEVLNVCERIAGDGRLHALGSMVKSASTEPLVRDWRPDFAFTHLFHLVLEDERRLLQFEELIHHVRFRELIWPNARALVGAAIRANSGAGVEKRTKQSIRWRIAIAYYAHLKELYSAGVLREAGFATSSHPVADALFRTDLWIGDANVDLFLPNERFRSGDGRAGRKRRSSEILADAQPSFRNIELACPEVLSFGRVSLPHPGALVTALRNTALVN